MSWRGVFAVLAGFGLVLLLTGWLGTAGDPAHRPAGPSAVCRARCAGSRILLRDRLFVGSAMSAGLASASLFAYISGSTFVLQRIYGLSAQGFSLAFGANSLGIMAASQVGGRLARRWSALRVLALGLVINLAGSTGLVVTVLLHLGLPYVLGSLFVMVSALGLVFPTATALAMADYPDQAGAASSLLGVSQFVVGGGGRASGRHRRPADGRPPRIVAVSASARPAWSSCRWSSRLPASVGGAGSLRCRWTASRSRPARSRTRGRPDSRRWRIGGGTAGPR